MSDKEKLLEKMRHSASHVMAQAVLKLFPKAQLGIGPAISDGFYYDFKLDRPLIPQDLKKIEQEMSKIKKADLEIEKKDMSRKEAIQFFENQNQPFKVELIKEIPEDEKISVFKQGDFVDLCEGPHLESTKKIGEFKLTSIAGAYWRGSEKNPQMQRIYGTTFQTKKALKKYLEKLAEAKKRDHRILGQKLDLYSISDEIGPGLVLWHPNGAILRNIIENFWKIEHQKRGYKLVYTPHIARTAVWKKSGHLDFFKENMFSGFGVDKDQYLVKPMNCPFHIAIFNSHLRSWRDLPLRYTELGTVYRYERSGVLHGLVRVRGFTQDDAHIFCTQDQLEDELIGVLDLTKFMLNQFGLGDFKVFLSTRPEKFTGKKENWEIAEKKLAESLKKAAIDFKIDKGEGAFYGPKIDFKIKDALGNFWQGPTIQLDFSEPKKFDLSYIDKNNQKQTPVMIHRTVLGTMERFIGLLIEHFGGAFPVWLAPVQIKVIPVAERHSEYSQNIVKELGSSEFRVELDNRNETVGKKIRDAELGKIPYILVIGDRELKSEKIAVRKRGKKEISQMTIQEITANIKK